MLFAVYVAGVVDDFLFFGFFVGFDRVWWFCFLFFFLSFSSPSCRLVVHQFLLRRNKTITEAAAAAVVAHTVYKQ